MAFFFEEFRLFLLFLGTFRFLRTLKYGYDLCASPSRIFLAFTILYYYPFFTFPSLNPRLQRVSPFG